MDPKARIRAKTVAFIRLYIVYLLLFSDLIELDS
jgi:hypothetical protein